MLQTNNTGVCSQCLSHTGSSPHFTARNHPWPAQGCLHLPGPSRSGSGTRVVLRGADSWLGLRFVPFQAAQVMRCLVRTIAATYRLPTARLSRCATSAPSQADVDCPDPQEVLVSKEACLQFYR